MLTIYKSSAGSGKTFTLVKEYLKIVLQEPKDYQHILAITFTNKATEEMKNRVVEELNALANGEQTDMYHRIVADFEEMGVEVDVVVNAKRTLNRLLHNYSRFEISTIDSFFSKIIRSFARELNLPMRYSIDLNQDKALTSAIDQLYNNLHDNTDMTRWLNRFTRQKMRDSKGWNIDHAIQQMGKELFKEEFHLLKKSLLPIKILEKYTQKFFKEKAVFEKKMQTYADDALALLKQYQLVPKDFRPGAVTFFTDIEKKKYEPKKTFVDILTGEKEWYAKKAKKAADIEELLAGGFLKVAQQSYDFYVKNHQRYFSNKAILETIYTYGILSELGRELKIYRDENNILLISDTNALIKEAIGEQDAPLVLEKMGSWYKHILIDEFQDTSDFQWYNLLPLVINSLADDHQVLIVGDVKQSIYRWRGGNMKLLLEKVQKDLKQYPAQVKVLDDNYRSKENIVNFNNAFFEAAVQAWANSEDLEDSYLLEEAYKSHQQNPQKGEGGYVEINFIPKPDKDDPPEVLPQEAAIIETIKKLQTDQYRYEDILILVNRNQEATDLAEALAKAKIPFVTQQSLLLKNSPIIQLILSFLQYFHNRFDPLIRTKLLYQYCQFKNIAIDDVSDIFTDYKKMPLLVEEAKKATVTTTEERNENGEAFIREDLPAQAVMEAEQSEIETEKEKEAEKIQTLFDKVLPSTLLENIHEIHRKPLVEIVEELVHILELNSSANNYVQRFQDICLDIVAKSITNIGDFLDWWDEHKHKTSILSSEGTDAIQIMTIHKAKGLEAPVVLLPYSSYSFSISKSPIVWADVTGIDDYKEFAILPLKLKKEMLKSDFAAIYEQEAIETMLDTLNKVYVAFTRPKERLYVFCNAPAKTPKIHALHNLLAIILKQNNFPFKEYWSEEDQRFAFGEPTPKEIEKTIESESSANTEILENYFSEPFEGKLHIRTEKERYYEIIDSEKTDVISMGIKVHTVLEKLDDKQDLAEVIEQLIRDRVLKASDKETITQQVTNLFNRGKFQRWFEPDWEVLTERAIFHKGQFYKPDRVVVNEQEAIIVDYKKEVRSPSHRAQIRAYGNIIKTMGYDNIKMFLVYVQSGVIDELVGV